VHGWDVLAWRGHELDARITCGSGTYVRALARDLGRLAGSAAHLAALRRTRSGPFAVADAASLADLRDGRAALRPALDALRGLPAERLDDEAVRRVLRGQQVEARVAARRASLVDAAGRLIAVGERSGAHWQPRAVLVDA
jgi:tRNA pseudouridine55 synthase